MCVASASFGILFAGSRAAWLVLGGVIIAGYAMIRRLRLSIRIPRLSIRTRSIILLVAAVIFLPIVLLRLHTLPQSFSENGSGMYRLRHLALARDYMMAYPLGIGLYVFQYVTPMTHEARAYSYFQAEPHNIAAQIGSELGFFGLLLFCYVFFRIITRIYQEARQYKNGLGVGILLGCLSYLGIACFYPWFLYSPISELFWMLAGVTIHETQNSI